MKIEKENLMTLYSDLKCWELLHCDHLDCLARTEPETPCWRIAIRVGSFRHISNTCRDCIVYLLQKNAAVFSKKETEEILSQRENFEKIGTGYRACILKHHQ